MKPAARPAMNRALNSFGTTIFAEMTRLAIEHKALNLGQGFPDFPGPAFIKDAAKAAIDADHNQYARSAGVPALVRAIAAKVERCWGLEYDPMEEVTLFSGCTEAILCSLMALCEPGDEVILFEPYYDCYKAAVTLAGAVPRFVTLRAPEFRWDPEELARAFTPRTRALLINSPHNPTGRVLDREELTEVARLAREHDVYVIADEVYEHMVFEGEHIPMASLEGMRERTVSLNSTGKTYSLTGWKIGYATAPAELSHALRTVHQFITYSTATPLQHAMIAAFEAPQSYYDELHAAYAERRRRLMEAVANAGFGLLPQQGTYFLCADIRPLGFDDDVAFCRHLIDAAGVVAIPPSAFYEHRELGRSYVRFSFSKRLAVLDEAAERLASLRR